MRILLALGSALVIITLLNLFLKIYSKKANIKISWQHYFFGYLFIIYLFIALSEIIGFPTLYRLQKNLNLGQVLFNPKMNLIPFNDGFEISTILNMLFFIPFGFLLPTLWIKYRKLFAVIVHSFIFSFIIEISQVFTHRVSDITDIIVNIIGAILGWLLFCLLNKLFFKFCKKTAIEITKCINREYYIYILISIICVFLS